MQPVEEPAPVISTGSGNRGRLILAAGILAMGLVGLAVVIVAGGADSGDEGESRARLAVESGFDAELPGGLDPAGPQTEGAAGEPSQRPSPTQEASPTQGASVTPDPTPTTTAAFEGSLLLDGPEPLLDDLASVLGAGVELTQLVVYPTYAMVTYRSPDEPANLDRILWREGAFDAPDPEGFADEEADALFTMEGVALDQLPGLARQALDGFALDGGEVTHAIVDRFTFLDDGAVAIRVYVSHPERGGGGYLVARADGTFVELVG